MVIAFTSRAVGGGDGEAPRTLWNFRHDKILEYFLVQLFLGPTPEVEDRILKHLDAPRFRGVYFLLADLLRKLPYPASKWRVQEMPEAQRSCPTFELGVPIDVGRGRAIGHFSALGAAWQRALAL